MKFLFIINIILISVTTRSQTLFNNRYGSQLSDEGNAICITKDGGYAVTGISSANGAGGDIFLMKLNQQGVIQWQKNIFGVNVEQIAGVFQLPSGNFILGGTTYSYGSGCQDAFEVMMDSTGNLIWSRAYGDVNCNVIRGFSLAHGDGFIACGSSGGGGNDGWLIKTDENGSLEWSKYYQSTQGFFAVAPTIDAGYLAIGNSSSISILKTDSTGNPSWFKRYLSSSGNTTTFDVTTFKDGTAAIVGQVYINAYGAISDVFLMKVDPSGNLIWFKTYGYTFVEKGLSVKNTVDGGFIIGGYTNSFGHGDDDALLLKTDSSGNLMWAKTYGGVWYDRAEQVQVTNDAGYVFVGTSYSSANTDSSYVYVVKTDSLGNSCNYLDWTPLQQTQAYQPISLTISSFSFGVDSTCLAPISNYLFSENNICIVNQIPEVEMINTIFYPDPVISTLSIKGLTSNSTINIYELTGELILTQRIIENREIDLSFLKPGVYLLQSDYGVKKLVKM